MNKNTKKEENNYAFIDSQNLYQGVSARKWDLDYNKFRTFLAEKYGVTKAYLFIGFVSENTSLYSHLQEAGYILIFKSVIETITDDESSYKGNVDAELVLQSMIQLNNYDKAVIVSGDGDFFCLVEYLNAIKKLKKVLVPNNHYSTLYKKYEREIDQLDKHKAQIGKQKRNSRPRQNNKTNKPANSKAAQPNKNNNSDSK